nr:TRAP transporter small permease [Salinarimonas soli]
MEERPAAQAGTGLLDRVAATVNRLVMVLGGVALIAASLVLTYSVVARYVLKIATDWQDESAVFLLVGTTFLCAAAVQARRGHVGIEAVASLLSERANRLRLVAVDVMSAAFCAFFAWKSWTLFHEAWIDDQHSTSSWGPPLWIPYSLMAAGMTLLTLQIALQLARGLTSRQQADTRASTGSAVQGGAPTPGSAADAVIHQKAPEGSAR